MKAPKLAASMLAMGWAVLPVLAADPLYEKPVTTRPAVSPAAGDAEGDLIADYVLVIERAEDPMAAISAYARGLAVDAGNVALHKAYVRRMVADALPALAVESAEYLVGADPGDGLAWAVLARAHLRGKSPRLADGTARLPAGAVDPPAGGHRVGDSPPRQRGVADGAARRRDAVVAIIHAVKHARREPFVLTTAGEVLAALDAAKEKPDLPADLARSLEAVRKDLAADETFLAAFKAARLAEADAGEATPGDRSAESLYAQPPVSPEVAKAEMEVLERRLAALRADASSLAGAMRGRGSYRREGYDGGDYADRSASSLTILNLGDNVYRPGVIGFDPRFVGRSIGYGFSTGLSISGSWSSGSSSGVFRLGSPWADSPPAPSYYGSTYGWYPSYYGGYYGLGGGYLGGPPYYFNRHLPSPSSGPTGPSHRPFIRPFIGHRVHSR